MAAAGAVYASKSHTKLSREYSAKKRWLGTNLCYTHTKISDAHTIKKRWPRTKAGAVYAAMHTKISGEYTTKKTLVEGST